MASPIKVEIYYDDDWHTADVFSDQPLTLRRGQPGNMSIVEPGQLMFSLANPDDRYSPLNPESDVWGKVGQFTPVRVSWTEPESIRGVFEIDSWPQEWTTNGNKVWAPITAYGILRRLGLAGEGTPGWSPQFRAHRLGVLSSGLLAWWPLEAGDLREQQESPSGIDGWPALTARPALVGVTREFGAFGGARPGPPGAASCTDLSGGGMLEGPLPETSGRQRFEISFKMDPPENPGAALMFVFTDDPDDVGENYIAIGLISDDEMTGGAFGGWWAGISWRFDNTSDDLYSWVDNSWTNGVWRWLQLELSDDSGDTAWHLLTVDAQGNGAMSVADTAAFAYRPMNWLMINTSGDIDQVAHAGWWTDPLPYEFAGQAAFQAHSGWEQAHERAERVCAEDGVPIQIVGAELGSQQCGPQPTGHLLEILEDAAAVDGALVDEARDELALRWTNYRARLNPDVLLDMQYGDITPPLRPNLDAGRTVNEVTVRRDNGASTTLTSDAHVENAPLPVAVQPGRIPLERTLSFWTDRYTRQAASWLMHEAVWPEPRYDEITVDLRAWREANRTALLAAVADLDVGARLRISGQPLRLGPWPVDQIIQGYTETVYQKRITVTANTVPARPWLVGKLGTHRVDTDICVLVSSIDADDTTLTTEAQTLLSFLTPYDIMINGEQMTVTNVVDVGGDIQTVTVVRAVNGVHRSHAAGSRVRIYDALRLPWHWVT